MATTLQSATRRGLRVLVSVVAMLAFGAAIWASGRVALSRVMVRYGLLVVNPEAVEAAIGLTPMDADGHQGRAALYNNGGQPTLALKELELAVSLRPRDYDLWLELGITRDELGDAEGALASFNKSVDLARYYSKPHWQRGNVLFRMGRYDEAFADLRAATASDPDLLPSFVDLAWGASRQDARLTEQIVQPGNDSAHLALARLFANHGKPSEAVAHFKLVHRAPEEIRKELIRQLVASESFKQAFELWIMATPQAGGDGQKTAIYDAGFEGSLMLDESGFGWRLAPPQETLKLSQDPNQPHSGLKSLRVDFIGNSNPTTQIVSQLFLVEPSVQYKLSFAARAQKIITGGAPVLTVNEGTGERRQLARSESLAAGTGGWQTFSVMFSTGPKTAAIVISLLRESCATEPCPIFGSLNLDSFSLERVL